MGAVEQGQPDLLFQLPSWIVTAGGVRPNALAALTILPWPVIAWMARSC